MKKIYWQIFTPTPSCKTRTEDIIHHRCRASGYSWKVWGFIVFAVFGLFYQTALGETDVSDSPQNSSPVPDVSDISLTKVMEQADNFLKSDSVQKAKDKAAPILAKVDAWRKNQIPKLLKSKENSKPDGAKYFFYAAALKAFSSKSAFYGGAIFLALIVLSRIKKIIF